MKTTGLAPLWFGIVCLIVASTGMAAVTLYSSDSLYAYSMALDVIQFHTLSGWTYSAVPFFFPDVLLALPLAGLLRDPWYFHLASSPVLVLLFVAGVSRYLAPAWRVRYADAFVAAAAAVTGLVVAGLVLPAPFEGIVTPAFVFVYHASVAFVAVALYLLTRADMFGVLRRHWILSLLAVVLLTLSDLYFAVYFGALILVSFEPRRWRPFLALAIPYGVVVIAVLVLSLGINDSLLEQATGSLAVAGEPYPALRHGLVLLWVPGLAVAGLAWRRRLSSVSLRLYAGMVLAMLLIIAAGLIRDVYGFRYLVLVYAVSIVLYAELLICAPVWSRNALLLAATLFLAGRGLAGADDPGIDAYQAEIACIADSVPTGATIVAEYWPAKMVFETLHRRYNLLQVTETLRPRGWISNRRWRRLHPDNGISLVVAARLEPDTWHRLQALPDARALCGGLVLEVKQPARALVRQMQAQD
ncbi:MAG: hypothetical protein QM581_01495 [Pseudomonas sp.]